MPNVKILKEYDSTEGWKAGQIADITNPWTLIEQGIAVLVDEQGNEIEHPDILMNIKKSVTSKDALSLIRQMIDTHPNKKEILKALASEKPERDHIKEEIVEMMIPEPEKEDSILQKVAQVQAKERLEEAVKAKEVIATPKRKQGRPKKTA